MTTTKGLLGWTALIALSVLGLVTGWSQAILGWALGHAGDLINDWMEQSTQ